MTPQTQDNKDRLEKLRAEYDALLFDLIGQGLRAACKAGTNVTVWAGKDGLTFQTDDGAYLRPSRYPEDLDALIDALEELFVQAERKPAPGEKDEEETDDE